MPKLLNKQEDNPAQDLLRILNVKWTLDEVFDPETTSTTETSWSIPEDVKKHLMEQLVMYVSNRDHRIWNHAHKLGFKDAQAKAFVTTDDEYEQAFSRSDTDPVYVALVKIRDRILNLK